MRLRRLLLAQDVTFDKSILAIAQLSLRFVVATTDNNDANIARAELRGNKAMAVCINLLLIDSLPQLFSANSGTIQLHFLATSDALVSHHDANNAQMCFFFLHRPF